MTSERTDGPGQRHELTVPQKELVRRVSTTDSGRVLIQWPAGQGLSTALVEACCRALARDADARILVIAPVRTRAEQWGKRLLARGLDFTFVHGREYRRLEADTPADRNPLDSVRRMVTTLDFLLDPQRRESLIASDWDLVIVDEAHHAGPQSQRRAALEDLAASPLISLLIMTTATPARLLEPSSGLEGLTAFAYWTLEPPVVAPRKRRNTLQVVATTPPERAALEAARTWIGTSPSGESDAFLSSLLRRRAASSLYALDVTLRSLDSRLGRTAQEPASLETEDEAPLPGWTDEQPTPLIHGRDRSQIKYMIGLLEAITIDSKADALASVVQETAAGPIVVFTDFADTVHYLVRDLRDRDIPAFGITAESSVEEVDAANAASVSGGAF